MNLQALLAHRFPSKRISYGPKDTILYALSVGVGADPSDPDQLRMVYERNLFALPTMAAVLAHPGAWIANPAFEVDFPKLLHGEQNLTVHRPLPAEGAIEASYRVPAVVDKGAGKGALVYFEKSLTDVASGELLCTVSSTLFLRADGGCGSHGTPPPALSRGPARIGGVLGRDQDPGQRCAALPAQRRPEPDTRRSGRRPQGRVRPSDPARPLHLWRGRLSADAHQSATTIRRVSALSAHGSARRCFPGESIRIEGSRDADVVRFQALVPERNQVVLSQGYARIA